MSEQKVFSERLPICAAGGLRQFRHNNEDIFVMGYDLDISNKVVAGLQKRIDDLEHIIQQIASMEEEEGRLSESDTLAEIFNLCREQG